MAGISALSTCRRFLAFLPGMKMAIHQIYDADKVALVPTLATDGTRCEDQDD